MQRVWARSQPCGCRRSGCLPAWRGALDRCACACTLRLAEAAAHSWPWVGARAGAQPRMQLSTTNVCVAAPGCCRRSSKYTRHVCVALIYPFVIHSLSVSSSSSSASFRARVASGRLSSSAHGCTARRGVLLAAGLEEFPPYVRLPAHAQPRGGKRESCRQLRSRVVARRRRAPDEQRVVLGLLAAGRRRTCV